MAKLFFDLFEKDDTGTVVQLPIQDIHTSRYQPRVRFDEKAMEELTESIRVNGLIQPITVREVDGQYEIIAGERRWRACKNAGLETIPCYILSPTENEAAEMALVENIQREDLTAVEEAKGYVQIMRQASMTQEEVARRIGKSQSAVANKIRLLNLPQEVQDAVADRKLSERHARALLAITDPELQYQTAQKVFDEKMTVRDVERLVRRMNVAPAPVAKRAVSEALQAVYANLAEQMKSTLGTKVSIAAKSAQRGKIEIEYFSADELDRLCLLLNSIGNREEV